MENEEILRELDVFLTEEMTLHLLQFPLRPCYSEPPNIQTAKWKMNHKKLELSLPFPKSIFSLDNMSYTTSPHHSEQKLISTLVDQQPTTLLASGVIRDNALHLTVIQDVLQIRPLFHGISYLSETVEDMEDDQMTESNDIVKSENKKPLQQVQMRRKENERNEMSRLHSYTYCKGKEDSEPWIALDVHSVDSNETEDKFESLYHSIVIATEIP